MALYRCLGCMEVFEDTYGDVCPHCGYNQVAPREKPFHLEPGSDLENGKYTIGKAIGSGGFAITYIAWDNVLTKKIAIKEYFPGAIANRTANSTKVMPYDDEDKIYQYEMGINSFVEEALNLVQLDEKSGIVHAFDSFIANNTAYIVMDYIPGKTLKEIQKEVNGPIPYTQVAEWIVPVLKSLDEVHKKGVIHRDIAPDNIMVNENAAKLIDFGAARNCFSETKSIQLKRGYAPEEQYTEHGNQGPWTDTYAIAATMYHLITGKLPQESTKRREKDTLLPPSQIGIEIAPDFEAALMQALSLDIEKRFRSAGALAEAFKIEKEEEPIIDDPVTPQISKKTLITIASIVAVVLVGVIIAVAVSVNKGQTVDNTVLTEKIDVDEERIPNFVGYSYYEAYEYMTAKGWKVSFKRDNTVKDKASDTVIKQDVPENQPFSEFNESDRKITFTVSKQDVNKACADISKYKWALMPNVVKKSQKDAESILSKHGFANVEIATKQTDDAKEGTVIGQSVKTDTKTNTDKNIVITVAITPTTTTRRYTTERDSTTRKKTTTTKKTVTMDEVAPLSPNEGGFAGGGEVAFE